METPSYSRSCQYRVWIVAYRDWQPRDPGDVPPKAIAVEPAEEGLMSAREAARYVEAFNRAAQTFQRKKRWAVALPVALHYRGDPIRGQTLHSGQIGSHGAQKKPAICLLDVST